MTLVTAHDYAWIRSSPVFRNAIEGGYGLTLVRGVAPGDVLRAMGAELQGTCTGVDALIERHAELRDATDYWDDSFIAGAFTVPGTGGDWTLVLQFDGGVGMQPRFLEALSAGGRAVTHSTNGGAPIDLFHWYEAGELRTTFEWPTDRYGSTPDDLVPVMREIGFDLPGDEDSTGPSTDTKAAVLALTERLAGVRLTEDLLKDAEYHLGHVPEEPAEEWTKVVIDITDANGERFYKEVTREEVEAASARAREEAEAPIVILGPSSPIS
jgi:choline dehydrogenase-like flavoprotein